MATQETSCSSSDVSQEDDWDDYLHGMFKKLKVDPEQLKEKMNSNSISKKSSRWYNQSIKTPKKTRKSLAMRSSRNRLSPYKNLLTCHGGKISWENPVIRSSAFDSAKEQGACTEIDKVWSDVGKAKGRFMSGAGVCSCNKKEKVCSCSWKSNEKLCKCGQEVHNCRFGSICKAKLLTFRTLATIVEESSEVATKEKEKKEENRLKGASRSNKKVIATIKNQEVMGSSQTAALAIPHFSNYRNDAAAAVSFSPKISLPASLPEGGTLATTPNSSHSLGSTSRAPWLSQSSALESRMPARPEYSCSQEARMAVGGLPEDTSVDDLAGYLDSIVYIPRKMSAMAEMMYT